MIDPQDLLGEIQEAQDGEIEALAAYLAACDRRDRAEKILGKILENRVDGTMVPSMIRRIEGAHGAARSKRRGARE